VFIANPLVPAQYHGSTALSPPALQFGVASSVPITLYASKERPMIRRMPAESHPLIRYLVAALATALAAGLTHVIEPLVYPTVTPLFILAVAVATLYGGIRAGIFAMLLSYAAISFWFFPPLHSFRVQSLADLSRQIQFVVVACVVIWMAGRVHAQRAQAVHQAQENERLRRVAEEVAVEAEMAAQQAAESLARELEADRALRQREAELADYFETAPIPMHWVAEDGTILRVNQAELNLLGYERGEYLGQNIAQFHVDKPVIDTILARLLRGERIQQHPARLRCKSGEIREVLIDSSGYFRNGQFVHSRCVARDVTSDNLAQEASARLAAIIASSADAIVGKTLDGTITTWNASAERIFGYSASEMIGQSVFRLIPQELHADEQDVLARLARGETVAVAEVERIRKDGERIWISLSISPIRDSEGVIRGLASIKRDITERKRAEAELRDRQHQLQLAHEAAHLGTWRWDITRNVLHWDEGLRELFGLRYDEQVREYDDFVRRIHPDDRQQLMRATQQAIAGDGYIDQEFRALLPDGHVRWFVSVGRIVRDVAGTPVEFVGVAMDITERKAVEEHLRDTQRLQAVGRLAGGIAHEANNQMYVVLSTAHFLLRRSDLPDSARSDVEQIRHAAERTASITQQLLAFSRRQMLELKDVNLNVVVQEIEPVLRRSLMENQKLSVELEWLGGHIRADRRQLEQVLLNLTLNARDAMPDGGQLTISTREIEVGAAESGSSGPAPGVYHLLVVSDTGHGMDQATLERAFEPFFTTKEIGRGTGLGLSVVHGIVSQIGGQIRVTSTPGGGAEFTLYFPVMQEPLPTAVTVDAEPARPSQGTVALIVEDDALVRELTGRVLAEAGYSTLEAENGQVALELIRRRAGRVDLVITDIGMPEMNGYELARCLSAQYPDVPVLFMTGYGDQEPSAQAAPGSAWSFLRKPFAPDALARVAAELLRPRRG
jgi:two-component system, cell cycle sensor histidine kinase and response regulator CckA